MRRLSRLAARAASAPRQPLSLAAAAQQVVEQRWLSSEAYGGGGEYSHRVKARGGAKAKQYDRFKARPAAETPPPAAPPPQAAPQEPPPLRLVAVPERVSVVELARALGVPRSQLEALMATLGDAPASEEECVAPHSPLAARLTRPTQDGDGRDGRALCPGAGRRAAAAAREGGPAKLSCGR